jgi:hypothetical protein
MTECFPSTREALGSIPALTKKNSHYDKCYEGTTNIYLNWEFRGNAEVHMAESEGAFARSGAHEFVLQQFLLRLELALGVS